MKGQIYLRAAAAASPSHELCRPPLSRSSRPRPRRPPVRSRRAPPWCADTPPHAGPRPLRLAVARVRKPSAACCRASACLSSGRCAPPLPWRGAQPRVSSGCARCRTDQCCPAGVAAGDGRPQPQRGARPRDLREAAAAGPSRRCSCPVAGYAALLLQTYRAAGWSARFADAGCPAHLPRWWLDCAAGGSVGEASASAGRLAAPPFRITQLCLRVSRWPRQRCWPGCDHLGGCCPLPRRRGGISLKEAGTSLFPAVRIGASCRVRERGCGLPGCGARPSWPEPELGTHIGG